MPIDNHMLEFYRAASTAANVEAVHHALEDMTRSLIGVRLFTLMTFDREAGLARRCYSNMPDAYPCSGTKPVDSDRWSEQVLNGKQSFVANDIEGIADVFSDHELIASLGCESVLNVPVVIAGTVLGTINCLHESGFYTSEKVAASEALKLPGSLCFFMEKLNDSNGGH